MNRIATAAFVVTVLCGFCISTCAAQKADVYRREIRPLLKKYCFECHSRDVAEAEINLERFAGDSDLTKDGLTVWLKVRHILDSRQMPPKDSVQPSDQDRVRLTTWVRELLADEARRSAGDPGEVVLRRLSNAEYTYTIQDLTRLSSLTPAAEFPVDGAAGEGFTNTGSALVMSPSLVQKYLDAGKEIAKHAILFPDGIRFSPHTSERDLTDELLAKIRALYFRYAKDGMKRSVNLWGGSASFDSRQAGLLDAGEYIAATIEERDAIKSGEQTTAAVAAERGLSPAYLSKLWLELNNEEPDEDSFLMRRIRRLWRQADSETSDRLIQEISSWQPKLWKFNVVGHLGREGAPKSWMEPVSPILPEQSFRFTLSNPDDTDEVVVCLSATDLNDGNEDDYVDWSELKLEAAGRATIDLRYARAIQKRIDQLRTELRNNMAAFLAAASEVVDGTQQTADHLADRHNINADLFRVWLNYLAIGSSVEVNGHFTEQFRQASDYDFVNGWHVVGLPSITANSSDQEVRIPGIARPHGLTVHPTPAGYVAIGWRSPISGQVKVRAALSDAHPECGNGIEWFLKHRMPQSVSTLWQGDFTGGGTAEMPEETILVSKGDLVSLLVGPRQGNHYCDLTAVDLTITEAGGDKRVWDAAKDNSGDILSGNPHADGYGNGDTWHFYHGEMSHQQAAPDSRDRIPAGSLLALWLKEKDRSRRTDLGNQLVKLLKSSATGDGNEIGLPDNLLREKLLSLPIPVTEWLTDGLLPDARFGKHPLGHDVAADHLVVKAPAVVEFRIPAELAEGREFTAVGRPEARHGAHGTTQLHAGPTPADISKPFPQPVICAHDQKKESLSKAFRDFRDLFPFALCYSRIVPVDEVVTATLFHREDELFVRLMLQPHESVELDRLWGELYYVAEEPLKAVVALEQIREFSTQDRPDQVGPWDRLKPIVAARADKFRQQVRASEPLHLKSVLQFADSAWRRPLTAQERTSLTNLYRQLRKSELTHKQAIRLLVARVLTSPAFLYRREVPNQGTDAGPVSDIELASRLSYFLWSSMPDDQLRLLAEQNRLTRQDDRRDGQVVQGNISDTRGNRELVNQTHRMLADARIRRLAIHFACQWLHVRDFDRNDDKNEQLYPEFRDLRDDMYEETVRFFEDLFRNNRSILSLIDADHTFVNEALAKHYGIDNISGAQWRRADNVRSRHRGGLLTMATFLASQSGASRTSPILRGNWLSETLLGEKLPRPPADVPQLPDTVPDGLTERQLIEKHSSDPACAKCHARIDPYGFALEQYDAIGRLRPEPADTATTLYDGTAVDGIDGLRQYLLTQRRDDIVRQFCRKLLGFALAREVQLSDEPLLDRMMKKLKSSDYKFHVAVESVVTSRQFTEIRGRLFNPQLKASAGHRPEVKPVAKGIQP